MLTHQLLISNLPLQLYQSVFPFFISNEEQQTVTN